MKNAMTRFIYDLRITAEVHIVELPTSDISAYAAQRSVGAAERQALMRQLRISTVEARNDVQALMDEYYVAARSSRTSETATAPHSVLARKPAKKPSIFKLLISPPSKVLDNAYQLDSSAKKEGDDAPADALNSGSSVVKFADESKAEDGGNKSDANEISANNQRLNEFTFSPSALQKVAQGDQDPVANNHSGKSTRSERRLHSAKRLNELIVERSALAAAVLINLPTLPKRPGNEYYYLDYVETLTNGLKRVILIRGSGREVVTAFAE
ncbi:unnamed protein product [Dibothriocephalus latus]|uniref:SLC12A transporter C-terminal domain-containing protein n=1 Tax=Dibothriocephalus latus TaxID=60516 RepID=A0A3P7PBN9_DIBLA|nr:unnamed protein product [Dibothriocephalus latus]